MRRENWKRIAAHVVGISVVLLVLAYAVRPSPHVPLYDANLVRLAETERQGYCSGTTFWRTQGEGDTGVARECRETHPEESGRVNLLLAERGFCRGIVDGGWDGGSVTDCVAILGSYQYWPTYDGSITDQWNRARPYPRPAISGAADQTDDSRTGGRTGSPSHPSGNRYGYGGTP